MRLSYLAIERTGTLRTLFNVRLLLIASLLVSACAAVGPDRSDLAIEEAIRARFARSKIAPNKFAVKVQRGVATLSGKTDVVQHKGTATRLAKNAGATNVINNIQVSPAAKEKAAAHLQIARETRKAKPRNNTATPKKSGDTNGINGASGAPANEPAGPGTVPPPVRRAQVKH